MLSLHAKDLVIEANRAMGPSLEHGVELGPINFQVRPGELLGLVGGEGTLDLLHHLALLMSPLPPRRRPVVVRRGELLPGRASPAVGLGVRHLGCHAHLPSLLRGSAWQRYQATLLGEHPRRWLDRVEQEASLLSEGGGLDTITTPELDVLLATLAGEPELVLVDRYFHGPPPFAAQDGETSSEEERWRRLTSAYLERMKQKRVTLLWAARTPLSLPDGLDRFCDPLAAAPEGGFLSTPKGGGGLC